MNDEKQKRIEFSDMSSEKLADEIISELSLDGEDVGGSRDSTEKNAADPSPALSGKGGDGAAGQSAGAEHGGSLRSEETVGEMLLSSRERSGQTLEFMSQETKIPKQMLQYLETDNFEALPAKVYVKSFLRTYATALGLDVQHLLSKYELQTGQTHRTKGDHWEIETEVVEEKIRSPLVLRKMLVPAIAVAVVAVLVVKFAGRGTDRSEPPPQVDLAEELLAKREAPPAPAVEPQRAGEADAPAAVEPMELKITANPTDSCWIELETLSIVEQQPERAAFVFNLQPGRSRTFHATEEFRFRKIGNAGGIVLELDGSKLATLGKRGKVVTEYAVTRENLPKDSRRE